MSSLLLSPESVLNRLDGQHVSNQHVITAVITGESALLLNKLLDGQPAVFWVRLSPDITTHQVSLGYHQGVCLDVLTGCWTDTAVFWVRFQLQDIIIIISSAVGTAFAEYQIS